LRSKKIPPTISLLFKAFRVSLVNLYMALFVVESDLNPNCSVPKYYAYSNGPEAVYTELFLVLLKKNLKWI